MMKVNDLPLEAQFSLLGAFEGTAKQPYRAIPSAHISFWVRPGRKPVEGPADSLLTAPGKPYTVSGLTDPRIRFVKPSQSDIKTEPRAKRPWLQMEPHNGGVVVRLTSEGRRRLYALGDILMTDREQGKVR